MSVECTDDGTVIDNPNIHVGDTIQLNHIRKDGLSDTIGESYEFTIMAKVRTPMVIIREVRPSKELT